VVIAGSDKVRLRETNSHMRDIDLFGKLVSPLAIAPVDSISSKTVVLVAFGTNLACVGVGYGLIAWTYRAVPALANSKEGECWEEREALVSSQPPGGSTGWPTSHLMLQLRGIN